MKGSWGCLRYRVSGMYHYWRRRFRPFIRLGIFRRFPPGYLDHGILFIHIPKTAGTSIRRVLTEAMGVPDIAPRYWHDPADVYRWALGSERFEQLFRFTFVRHPVPRLFSAFHYVRAGKSVGWLGRCFREKYATFEEFVLDWLVPARKKGIRFAFFDGFWPQWWFISDFSRQQKIVNFIGKVEHLPSDWTALREEIQKRTPLQLPASLPRENVGTYRKEGLQVPSPKDLDSRVLERIVDFYAEDFRHLGYEPDQW